MKKLLAVLVLVLFGTASFAQWLGNGSTQIWTDPAYSNAKVGINVTNPVSAVQAYIGNGSCSFVAESPVTGAAGTIATFTLRNDNNLTTTSRDRFQFFFRKVGGNHEILQSCFASTTSGGGTNVTREFSYFNLYTGQYEIRGGVNDIKFMNAGTVAIGMGTYAVPAGALVAIGGKVVAKEIEVTLTGMPPDFVFNSDYKLASLYDVENFVNTNKHLPGVPSASEMTTNGVNVGDMNMTLLQKVEELTLYMINLQKENDALKARVSNLEK